MPLLGEDARFAPLTLHQGTEAAEKRIVVDERYGKSYLCSEEGRKKAHVTKCVCRCQR